MNTSFNGVTKNLTTSSPHVVVAIVVPVSFLSRKGTFVDSWGVEKRMVRLMIFHTTPLHLGMCDDG